MNSHFIRLATGSFLIWNTPGSKLSGVNWSTLHAGHAVKERFTSKNFTTSIHGSFIRPMVYET